MQESGSFWTDIKTLEGQLAASPDSLCFARLSEIYLKVGLTDDALHVARLGTKKHPRYLSGQRALSMACHAKGLNDEALAALRMVTEALPEDVPSQKLLGRLYAESGNSEAAGHAFRTALEFAPDDVECRIELESLGRLAGRSMSVLEADEDEEIIEDLEIVEEGIDFEMVQAETANPTEAFSEPEAPLAPQHDPLSTGTLAELYVRQGFIDKALDIYRAILADNPSDRATAKRIVELGAMKPAPVESVAVLDEIDDAEAVTEPVREPEFNMPVETFFQEPEPVYSVEPDCTPVVEAEQAFDDSRFEPVDVLLPSTGVADNAVATLDGWLENIRRIKSCR